MHTQFAFPRGRVLFGSALFALLLALLPAGLTPVLAAQETGVIRGVVRDANTQAPLPGAQLALADSPLGARSDELGRFVIRQVPAGARTLEVMYIGYTEEQIPVQIAAGDDVSLEIDLDPSYIHMGEIVVTSAFEGRARSLNEQRSSVGIKNVVFDQQFERMPDQTAADALSRVPGMASTFDSNTGYLGYEGDVPETSDISLRGLSPGMLAVSIDGQRVPSTSSSGRSVELAGLSLETIQSLEVLKAVTPEVDADAGAGVVNLRSRPPSGFHASGTMAGGYNSLVGTTDYRGSLQIGNRIGAFGFLLSGSRSRLQPGTDIVSNSWADREFGNGPEMVVRRFTVTNSQADRVRTSLNSTLSWDLGDRSALNFRGSFSEYSNDVSTQFLQLRPGNFLTPNVAEESQIRRRGLFTDTRTRTWSGMLGGEHPVGGVTVDYGVGYSRSNLDRPEYLLIENRMNGVGIAYDRSDPVFTQYEVTTDHDLFDPEDFFVTSTQMRDDFTQDEELSLNLNTTLPAIDIGGSPLIVKTGGKFLQRDRGRDYLRYFPAPADGQLWMTEVATSEEFRRISPADYRLGYTVDRARAHEFMDRYQETFGTRIDYTRSDAGDHAANESVYAAYVQGTLELGATQIIAGSRVEATRNSYVGMETVFGPDGEYEGTRELDSESSHVGFFPGIHLRYEANPRHVVRLAWTNTITRPAFSELAPTENINYESNRISRGNPELDATRSFNVDAQYDWYGTTGDHISVGMFYKDLTDFTGRTLTIVSGGTFDGFELSQYENFGDARTYGVETSFYKRLGFLPGALQSLAINANYTWAGSSTDFTQGRDLPLPNQSPHTTNIGLDFDHGPFRSSIAGQYQSDRLRHIGQDERYDMYLHRPLAVDFSASFDLPRGVQVFTQVSNLTGAPTYLYAGNDRSFPQRASFSEPIWMFGSRYSF